MCVQCEQYDLAMEHLAETETSTLGLTIGDVVDLGQELQERRHLGSSS